MTELRHDGRLPWHVSFTAAPHFFLLPDQRLRIMENVYVCIYTMRRDCIWITVATKQYCKWNIFTQIGAVRSADWIFITMVPAWRWLREYMTLERTCFSNLLSKQEEIAAPVTTIINNSYVMLEDFLLFKIPIGTRKNFFEIHRKFGHESSKRFASSGLESFLKPW